MQNPTNIRIFLQNINRILQCFPRMNHNRLFHSFSKFYLLSKSSNLNILRIFHPVIIQSDFPNRNNLFLSQCQSFEFFFYFIIIFFYIHRMNSNYRINKRIFIRKSHTRKRSFQITPNNNSTFQLLLNPFHNFIKIFCKLLVVNVCMCVYYFCHFNPSFVTKNF